MLKILNKEVWQIIKDAKERIAKARIILRNWASKKFTSDAVYREITYPSQQARLTEIDLI